MCCALQVREFAAWFGAQPHRHKVVIAGNHDTTLHEAYYAENWNRYHYKARLDDAEARRIMAEDPNFTYLEDAGACVLGCVKLGSSATMRLASASSSLALVPGGRGRVRAGVRGDELA